MIGKNNISSSYKHNAQKKNDFPQKAHRKISIICWIDIFLKKYDIAVYYQMHINLSKKYDISSNHTLANKDFFF